MPLHYLARRVGDFSAYLLDYDWAVALPDALGLTNEAAIDMGSLLNDSTLRSLAFSGELPY